MLQKVQLLCAKLAPLYFSNRQFHVSLICAWVQPARYEMVNYPHFTAHRKCGNNVGGRTYSSLNTVGLAGKQLNNNRGFSNGTNFGINNISDNNSDNNNKKYDTNNSFCVHLRGMPFSCDETDIMKFFSPLKPVHCKVIFSGRRSGDGIAYFQSHDEADEAMKRHKDKIDSRYIELFYDNTSTGNSTSNSDNYDLNNLFCVHLRGMPYSCDETDIIKFFSPLKPVHCKVIYIKKGQHKGYGIVYFESHDEAKEAMKRDKNTMGSRYIELFYDNSSTGKNLSSYNIC